MLTQEFHLHFESVFVPPALELRSDKESGVFWSLKSLEFHLMLEKVFDP